MQIHLIAIGSKMPAWVNLGYQEFAKRMPALCKLNLLEVSARRRGKNADIDRILRDEAAALDKITPPGCLRIGLDRLGKTLDTEQLAQQQQTWIDNSQDVAIYIGGPEGLSKAFLDRVDRLWSLSALTFPHPMVRLILAEQLYRAWSMNANLPYHRGEQ